MADKSNCSIIHIYLCGMLKRKIGDGTIIATNEIHPILKWHIRMPRKYQKNIIKELCELGLLKRLSREHFEIVEEAIKKPLYDSLGEPLW